MMRDMLGLAGVHTAKFDFCDWAWRRRALMAALHQPESGVQ